MTGAVLIKGAATALFIMMLAALFFIYRHPLFEIHLANWGLC